MPSKSAQFRIQELKKQAYFSKLVLGKTAVSLGPEAAARLFEVSNWVAKYWRKKYEDPNYCSREHGGARNCPFSEGQVREMCRLIYEHAMANPISKLDTYRLLILHALNLRVSVSYIKTVFEAAGWTYGSGLPHLITLYCSLLTQFG